MALLSDALTNLAAKIKGTTLDTEVSLVEAPAPNSTATYPKPETIAEALVFCRPPTYGNVWSGEAPQWGPGAGQTQSDASVKPALTINPDLPADVVEICARTERLQMLNGLRKFLSEGRTVDEWYRIQQGLHGSPSGN